MSQGSLLKTALTIKGILAVRLMKLLQMRRGTYRCKQFIEMPRQFGFREGSTGSQLI